MKLQAKKHLAPACITVLGLLLFSAPASAKEAVAHFSSDTGNIAVNSTGAGPADAGDVYVLGDFKEHHITRFATDDNGTPAEPYDDTFDFVARWGADVDAISAGGSDYEICTVQADCKVGVVSSANGAFGGNAFGGAEGIAIDQDTGQVYVSDTRNHRVNVYGGDGIFLRSFGWDVVESGPGDTPADEYEVCVAAESDVCKAGVAGTNAGQIDEGLSIAVSAADGNGFTGTVFLADAGVHRVNTYALDGSLPSSFGSAAEFTGGLAPGFVAVDARGIVYASDNANGGHIDRYDSLNVNGGGIGFLTPIAAPPLLSPQTSGTRGLAVDPDTDGGGPDDDALYVLRSYNPGTQPTSVIQQFGPTNDPGLTVAPVADDDVHGQAIGFSSSSAHSMAFDPVTGRIFVSGPTPTQGIGPGTYVLDEAGGTPTAQIDSISGITSTTAIVTATVNPNGPPPVSYRLEYSLNGTDWTVDPSTDTVLGTQGTPQQVSPVLNPPAIGLQPGTEYHVRLAATKVFNPPVVTAPETFTTLPSPPQVETTGAAVRSATTARFTGRLNPSGPATDYWFEYGVQGPCSSNPCQSTSVQAAGAGNRVRLLVEEATGLAPSTTYHYRLLADNGVGDPVPGQDMTVTTRASDAPLSHGSFPGPPGSDRAWEQVSVPDSSGNPVGQSIAFSDDGNRALYTIAGGTHDAAVGSVVSMLYAERPSGQHPELGWQRRTIEPPRDDLVGLSWQVPTASDDLSSIFAVNWGASAATSPLFRLSPNAPFTKLIDPPAADFNGSHGITVSEDGTRILSTLEGSHDPGHPTSGTHLYDISTGTPQLIDIKPDGGLMACGHPIPLGSAAKKVTPHAEHWVTPDGSQVFLQCDGLHVRDLEAQVTKQIAPPNAGLSFIKSTPGAVFFTTDASLAPDDSGGKDVYRYDLASEEIQCVTCVLEDFAVDVDTSGAGFGVRSTVAVAPDGSRVYFRSPEVLLPGAAPDGIYRVEVATGDLAYVANIGNPTVGDTAQLAQAINADGSVLAFGSGDPSLDPLGDGAINGGTFQYYIYDDTDRTITCVSCPPDGSPPPVAADPNFTTGGFAGAEMAPNLVPMSDNGAFAFVTAASLHSADQNAPHPGADPTRGSDVYEWRDGRALLVTDGLSESPTGQESAPTVAGVSPSGRDVFFIAGGQLTPDALDTFRRLYTARIGGGIDFPDPPVPCALEVCQGTPKGAPEESLPASTSFSGPGNQAGSPSAPKCRRGERRVRRAGKSRCVKQQRGKRGQGKRRANRNRRTPR